MKKPNGYGSVVKMSGKRRRPYRVRLTTGFSEGKQVIQTLGYYATRKEAEMALAEYHKAPYNLAKCSLDALYQLWMKELAGNVSERTKQTYSSAYKALAGIKDTDIHELRPIQLQALLDSIALEGIGKARTVRTILCNVFDYGIRSELVTNNPARATRLKTTKSEMHKRFTAEEIECLWEHKGEYIPDMLLILIYSGLRVGELLHLKTENIHLSEWYIDIKASKTKAGIRKVPVASKIAPILDFYAKGEYLVGEKQQYNTFHYRMTQWMVEHGMKHIPHDTRHTCVSMLADAGVDERYIQAIVGHSTGNVTRNVYQHLDLAVLKNAIDSI